MDFPETFEEAKQYRYGEFDDQKKYKEGYCAYEVWPSDGFQISYQCSRKNGHGINGLYCSQHAKILGE